ncbi:MAG: hypothetical protein ACOYYU_11030 [Chloroflexota bacterium]
MKKILILALATAFLVGACGPEPEPTLSVADVQGTALAAAQTMIAETQAAIPTATPIPPTETASPTLAATNTPITMPTLVLPPTSAPVQPTAADICNDPKHLIPGVDGPKTNYKIINESGVPMNGSLYLSKTPHGECGYQGFSVPKNGSTILVLPLGCYSAWAWSTDPKKPLNVEGYGLCANNTDKWTIKITSTQIRMLPP